MLDNFAGVKIFFDTNALQDTEERLFPFSKHRSKRIHKKLVKRHGGVYRKKPAIYKTPIGIMCHPSFEKGLKAQMHIRRPD